MSDDAGLAQELDAVVSRLAALAEGDLRTDAIGRELGQIRAELRLLAVENAEIGFRLGVALGLAPPDSTSTTAGAS